MSSDLQFQFLPEWELLGGVQSQTTWMDISGPKDRGNEYFRALQGFMAPYKEHSAIRLSQELLNRGFAFDGPPQFLCHLGPLPDLMSPQQYPDKVAKRVGDAQILEEFRVALVDLAQTSQFLNFFSEWEEYLKANAPTTAPLKLSFQEMNQWIQDFFGWPLEHKLVASPAMFRSCYGPSVVSSDGSRLGFVIITSNGRGTGRPRYHRGTIMAYVVIHEIVHSYANPSLDEIVDDYKEYERLLDPIDSATRRRAIPGIDTFLYETVVRAVTDLAIIQLIGTSAYRSTLSLNLMSGFYLTDDLVQFLRRYDTQRKIYPTFRDFLPELLDWLRNYSTHKCSSSRMRRISITSRALFELAKLKVKGHF